MNCSLHGLSEHNSACAFKCSFIFIAQCIALSTLQDVAGRMQKHKAVFPEVSPSFPL